MATNNWNDFTGTGLWGTASNWSLGEVPTSDDDVVFESGTTGTSYTVAGNGTANALNVFSDSVTFTGALTLGGIANVMNSGTITLSASATLSDLNSDIYVGDDEGANRSSGTLVVNGSATAQDVFIGSDGAGTADVSGAGALLSATDDFYIGEGPAPGTLNVSSGAEVSTQGTFYIGATPFDSGHAPAVATVTDATLSAPTLIIGTETEGSLTLQSGATAATTTTTIGSLGVLQIDDTSSISGAITIDGGTLNAYPEANNGDAGPGVVTLSNDITIGAGGANLGAEAPSLDLTGVLTGSGTVTINGGTVELANAGNTLSGTINDYSSLVLGNATAAGSATIAFQPGLTAQLTVDGAAMPSNTVTGFSAGDSIDMAGVAGGASGSATLTSGNVLDVSENGSTYAFHLDPSQDFSGVTFVLSQDSGDTGTLVTEESATCFCTGTLILTDHGEVPVESLVAGDRVVIHTGATEPVRWIGRRSYAGAFIAGNHLMLPICIKAGALADGVPRRDLIVSPGHAMYVDGALVPAWRLVNGVSITQAEAVESVTYYHVELDQHAVIVAEGAPAESYLDDGSRQQFHNAAECDGPASVTPFQPRLEDGFALQRIQERIAARAGVCAPGGVPGSLRGFVDVCTHERITGWAQDSAYPEQPVMLEVLVDGIPVTFALANAYRADLRQAGLGSGCHAFDIALPAGVTGVVEVRRITDGALVGLTEAARQAA